MICDSPFHVIPKAGIAAVPVPCGKCPNCKRRRINSWVFRLLQEEKRSSSSYFVTLTYDTRMVPITKNGFMTLCKKDFQDYMKRLRKLCPDSKLKYYAVGEYGSQYQRPHYHAIIFNVPEQEMFFDAWSLDGVPFGIVHVGTVTGDSIAYTAKYIDKPNFSKKHGRDDRVAEFSLMSKGLGSNYLTDDMINYHRSDSSRMYVTKEGGYRIALPRYYRDKIFSEHELNLQIPVIQAVADKQEEEMRREFELLGYPSGYTYEMWKSNHRYSRYVKFYKNQKSRQ